MFFHPASYAFITHIVLFHSSWFLFQIDLFLSLLFPGNRHKRPESGHFHRYIIGIYSRLFHSVIYMFHIEHFDSP